MPDAPQWQRHGPTKNLAEGVGGVLVGAALTLLLARWLRGPRKSEAAPGDTPAAVPGQGAAPGPE